MTRKDPLLQAVLDAPDDPAPRLVYADWLEDHGDPLGEFIQIQSQLADLAPDDLRWPALVRRERELLALHEEQWVGPLRALGAVRWGFRRGLVEEVTLDAEAFLGHAEALFRQAPVRRLTVRVRPGLLGDVLRSPALPRVTVLGFSWGGLGPGGVAALAGAPDWGACPSWTSRAPAWATPAPRPSPPPRALPG